MRLLLCLLLSLSITGPALASKRELDRPGVAFPVDFSQTTKERVLAALRQPDCKFVRGHSVNWITTLHYRGDTAGLNSMLRALQDAGDVELKLTRWTNASPEGEDWTVLHMGHGLEFTFYLNPHSRSIDVTQLAVPLVDYGSPAAARLQAGPLKTYAPEGTRWSFEKPVDAKLVVKSEVHGGPGEPVIVSLHCFDQPGVRCQLRQFDLPRAEAKAAIPELLGRYCLPQWGDPAKLSRGPTLNQSGVEGHEYQVAVKNPVRLRVFRTGGSVFVVSAATAADPAPGAAEKAEAFLNSFRIKPAAAAADPVAE